MGVMDSGFRRLNYLVTSLMGGRRRLYEVFGYTYNPSYDHKFVKYLRQGIAARVVDAPAAALWTNPPQITSSSSAWDEKWNDLVARYNLFHMLERADKLAGIGRFSILLIGYNDVEALESPVNTRSITQKSSPILYLQPYSERAVSIKEYNANPRSEDFNKPLIYEIQPSNEWQIAFDGKLVGIDRSGQRQGLSAFKVHASRVIHIAENCLENDVYGSPRIERVYNTLDDILKVTGGTAETFWLTANRGLHIDIDKELELQPGDAANLKEEISEYVDNLSRVIRTRGAKVNAIGSDTPDPTGVYNMLIGELSGATGIPRRILTGSEAGQLASDQDRANWADRIDERRADWANPQVIFQLIRRLTRAGYLPADPGLQITVNWPSAFKLSPLEMAQTSAQHARSATNFAKAIETMHNLNQGTPGSEGQIDPETGKPVPGTAVEAVPGAGLGDLVTVDEARKFIGLDKPQVTFDSGKDVNTQSSTKKVSNMTVSLSTIMRLP